MLLNFHKLKNKYRMKVTGAIVAGASTGQEHNTYKLANIDKIAYFEPMKEAFKKLQEKVCSGVSVYNYALSNFNGQSEMYIANNQQSSSLLFPVEHLKQHPDVKFTHKEIVEVRKLDDVLDTNYNLLVMDIQGGEGNLIDGASRTLEGIDYVYTEVNTIQLYKDCVLLPTLDEKLSKYNLKRVELVMTGSGWGDAFYIKD